MDTKLTYYDLVGFIIPGAVVVAILYWFVTGFLALPPGIGVGIPDNIQVVIFVAGSYFLGHVTHAVGVELLHDKEMGSNLRKLYFADSREHSPEYRWNLIEIFEQAFTPKLSWIAELKDYRIWSTESKDSEENKLRNQQLSELFHLCHALIRKEGLSANTDILEAVSNMYRGLYAGAFISAIVCILISLKQLILLVILGITGSLPNYPFFAFKEQQLVLGMFLTLLFIASAALLLRPRWELHKRFYVDSVLTAMYVLSRQKQEGQQQSKQTSNAAADSAS